MKGYKAFKKDFKCQDSQYKENEIFVLEDPELKMCENGFHFCKELNDVFTYYGSYRDFIICEVEALGDILTEDDKSCTNILAVKEKIIDFSTLEGVEKYADKFTGHTWGDISTHQNLSEEFIEKYRNVINWHDVSAFQILSEEFIEKYADRVFWWQISKYQKLSEKFIEKYADRVDWGPISAYKKLSEEFIEKHEDRVDWHYIVIYQKLSEDFIERNKDRVDWGYISIYQDLSDDFREKHADKLNRKYISELKVLSEKFRRVKAEDVIESFRGLCLEVEREEREKDA